MKFPVIQLDNMNYSKPFVKVYNNDEWIQLEYILICFKQMVVIMINQTMPAPHSNGTLYILLSDKAALI